MTLCATILVLASCCGASVVAQDSCRDKSAPVVAQKLRNQHFLVTFARTENTALYQLLYFSRDVCDHSPPREMHLASAFAPLSCKSVRADLARRIHHHLERVVLLLIDYVLQVLHRHEVFDLWRVADQHPPAANAMNAHRVQGRFHTTPLS